jgi:hypothetical protein
MNLDKYLQISQKYYDNIFDKVEHTNKINDIDVNLHFKFLKFDPNGNPKIDLLVDTLFSYFTHYCFSAQKRSLASDMDEFEQEQARNKLMNEARELFRKWKSEDITPDNQPKSGEVGEMILWLLMEVVLKAPQIVAKMDLKTNRKLEVFGSDGIHVNIDKNDILNIYFGEAKLYGDVSKALDSAFESIEKFHTDKMDEHEFNLVTTHYKLLKDEQQKQIYDFITGQIEAHEVKINHACLIGYDWNEYQKLDTQERKNFINNFTSTYQQETQRLTKLIQTRFDKFSKKEFDFEVFFLPFKSVQELRTAFNDKL